MTGLSLGKLRLSRNATQTPSESSFTGNGSFDPSPSQVVALKKMEAWYRAKPQDRQQVFLLTGIGGSGKSSLVNYFLNTIGLRPHAKGSPGYLSGTFSGKAAMVLRRMGVDATTIHRMIYRYIEPTQEMFAELDRELNAAERAAAKATGDHRNPMIARAARIKRQIMDLDKPKFVIDYSSEAGNAKLIVLDEVSMVGEDIATDLLSVAGSVPILVIGDPGQLPPIEGAGYFTERVPDATLTEIHRQAEGNPIVTLADLARRGKPIIIENYSKLVKVRSKREIDPRELAKFDLTICGKNTTRRQLNNQIRKARGFTHPLPTGHGEMVICLRNDYQRGLVNGMYLDLKDVRQESPISISAMIRDADDPEFVSKRHSIIYTGDFADHLKEDKGRFRRDMQALKGMVRADFGDVLTVHKSQGSGIRKLAIIDDGFDAWKEDASRMRYTAISRAIEELTYYV